MHGVDPAAGPVDGALIVAVLFAEAVGLYVGSGLVGSTLTEYLEASLTES